MMDFKVNEQLDVTQDTNEQALLHIKEKVEKMNKGEVLEILTSDKKFAKELKVLANDMRSSYFGDREVSGKHYIRKETRTEKSDTMERNYIMSLEDFTKKYEKDDDLYVLDVREDFEYAVSHVPGAVLIPLGELEANMDKIPKDKEVHIICRTGNRSDFAARILMESGYEHVFNIVPGMISWDGPVDTGIPNKE